MLLWSASVVLRPTPPSPHTHPGGAPSAPVLQACWHPVASHHLLTPFWELAPSSRCFACASFLGRMTSLPEREHWCDIQGSWAQGLHCFILIMKVMWDPCRISPEVSSGIPPARSPQLRDQQRSVLLTGAVPQALGQEEQGRGAQMPRCPQRSVRAALPMRLLACSPSQPCW